MIGIVYLMFRVYDIVKNVIEMMGNFKFFDDYVGENENSYD